MVVVAGYLLAPMTAVAPFGSRTRASDIAFGVALVLALLVRRLPTGRGRRLDETTRHLMVGVALVVGGVTIGEVLGGAAPAALQTLLLQVAAAILPVLLLATPSIDEPRRRVLARALVVGTLASVLVGAASQRLPSGRATGLAAHPNQLAMTCVIALALLPCAFPLRRSIGVALALPLGAVLLYGLHLSGSRSGALALIVMVAAASWQLVRHGTGRALVVIGCLLVSFVVALGGELAGDPVSTESLGQIVGRDDSAASDAERRAVLEIAIDELRPAVVLRGAGFSFERPPHNVFLEVLIAGGLLGLVGLVLIVSVPLKIALGVDRSPSSVRRCASAAALGFFVAVFFNNALWAPFAWCTLALLYGRFPRRRPTSVPTARSNSR